MSETTDEVSCFAADGIVAEMVIEVEESQKSAIEDLANSPTKGLPCDKKDYQDSGKKVESEEKQLETEKKEDKENLIKVPEIKEDKNMNIKEDISSNQTLKRKKNSELSINHSENKNKVTDMPRYSGRKRLANKRYSSEDMITSKSSKSESQTKPLLKDNPQEVKKRKLEADSKDLKKETKIASSNNHSKRLLRNAKESDLSVNEDSAKNLKAELSTDKIESESKGDVDIVADESKSKQDILRKLPFRKNKDAPDIPDFKPKVFWWNGVGKGVGAKLGDIPELKQRIKKAKSVRALYRVLFFQWPTNGQDLIAEILDFNGFPFDKSSYEFTKRQSLMKIMLDVTVSNICEILDLRKGDKMSMISNILNFLLTPYAKIDPSLEPSLQPVVVLERIEFNTFFDDSSYDVKTKKGSVSVKSKEPLQNNKEKTVVTVAPVRSTRNSSLKKRPVGRPVSNKTSAKRKENLTTNKPAKEKERDQAASKPISNEKIISARETKLKTTPTLKDAKQLKQASKDNKSETKEKPSKSAEKSVDKLKKLKKSLKTTKLETGKKVIKKKSSENDTKQISIENETKLKDVDSEPDSGEDIEMETEEKSHESAAVVKEKNKKELKKVIPFASPTITLSDSSETESSEETKLITASPKSARTPKKRLGKPLGHFPKISDCIQKANFSALQRLHILLFGASDKADNLKTNILAFGGFPFLEGSDEWKQKHFLLSLLAQNNLREYLNLLCIEYSDDDQPTMINKLMKFLAVPSDTAVESKVQLIETELVSSVLTNKSPTSISPKSILGKGAKAKVEVKKKVKKKEVKKTGNRHRKVLMSEEEARRMEASFLREQRAIARDNRLPPPISRHQTTIPITPTLGPTSSMVIQPLPQIQLKPPVADPNELNALLQTVFKRRALKAAGAVISTPNKGEKTKLGDIENIKFLIVTANLCDLEILHHLIFMMEAGKARLRKNILDFEGFGFNEDSDKYKERMKFLHSLGYDVSKRVSFLLGLCSLQTDIPRQDLNELIMYFLMSPCRTKQVVPITEMPLDPSIGASEESLVLLKSTTDSDKTSYYQNVLRTAVATASKAQAQASIPQASIPQAQASIPLQSENFQTSTPMAKEIRQKAKKSFSTPLKASPVKKILLPPSHASTGLNKQPLGNKTPIALLDSVRAVPSYSLAKMPTNVTVLNTPNNIAMLNAPQPSNTNSLAKFPVNPFSKVQLMNPPSKANVLDASTKVPVNAVSNIPKQILQSPVTFPQLSNKIGKQPQNVVPAPTLQGSKMVMKNPTGYVSSPQEFYVQQQTPDGQQKTFKLIRLPANHPLASVVGKPPVQQVAVSPPVQQKVVLSAAPSQVQQQVVLTSGSPGFLIMKNNSSLPSPVQNMQSNLQNTPQKVQTGSSISSQSNVNTSKDEDQSEETPEDSNNSAESVNSAESLNSVQENPPTDKELFLNIQEIILSSNFEDITLRNVIERVSGQFPHHDLTRRHNYMKECVKKIIIGTS